MTQFFTAYEVILDMTLDLLYNYKSLYKVGVQQVEHFPDAVRRF